MNKVKFETKQEYIDYCKYNELLNIRCKYSSQYTNIDNGIERETYFDTSCYINIEPKSYPCILVWDEYNDNIYGSFIYQNDFN